MSFYRCPSNWKFGKKNKNKNKNLPFTCEEGSQKVFVQIVKSKIHWRRRPLKAWNFFSWVQVVLLLHSAMSTTIYEISWHKHTHTHTHRAHFQRKLSDVQLSLGSSSRYGGAWSFEEEATTCQLQVFFLFFNCPTNIITVIWTRSPRTRRRSKSFRTQQQQHHHHHQQHQSSVVQHHLDDSC